MRIKEEIITRRLKGYFLFPRAFTYLLIDRKITPGDFTFYYELVSLARFDKRNPLYGVVDFTSAELAVELNLNPKTVRNHLKSLLKNELLLRREKFFTIFRYEDLFTNPRTFFTKGNQRSVIDTFFTFDITDTGSNKDASTVVTSRLDCSDKQNSEHIYEPSLGSYKNDVGSISKEEKGGDEYMKLEDIPL